MIDSRFEIRVATSDDDMEVNELFQRVFSVRRSLDEFDWKFRHGPNGGLLPIGIVATDESRIVANYGLLSHRINDRGASHDVVQVVDVCVDEPYRRTGLNRALFEFFRREVRTLVRFAFGFPGPEYAALGLDRLGYRILTPMRAYAWRASTAADTWVNNALDLQVELRTGIDDSWEDLLKTFPVDAVLATERTLPYLRWRYPSQFGGNYLFLTARHGASIEGIAVAKPRTTGITGTVWLYELLARSAEGVRALLQRLRQEHPAEIVYWCSPATPWQTELEALGFLPITRGPPYAMGIPLGESDPAREAWIGSSSWFLTMGDSDM